MENEARWYVLHTYSGYENAVKTSIEKMVENRRMQDCIHSVSIPMETVTEVSETDSKTVERKLFPGYVLIKMVMSDESWYLVRNVRGVSGFVGSGTKPTPLTQEEVEHLGVERREIVLSYAEGDSVRVNDGPLSSFIGTVEEIDIAAGKVVVVVSMFGRETPVELDLDQVEPVSV
ncbi:MAG: transcription termination/antitermination factor NusG [Oscillospiraceae bacterium]|nr:transcription termination/antitermination factor NusG [Oscillospiraceae bacterium]